MSTSAGHRLPFLVAVALVAAALGDAVAEGVSNTGVFGAGYFDHDHLSVVPTLLAGLALVAEIAVLRLVALLRGAAPEPRPSRPLDVAARLATRSPLRDLPLVFVLQLAALFAMQNAEQLAAGGPLVGGLSWLGGPVVFALLVQAAAGASCAVLLAALARTILAAGTSLIRIVLELVVRLAEGGAPPCSSRLDHLAPARAQAPHVRQIGGRAPPRLPATPV